MPDRFIAHTVSRSAYLELKQELDLVRTGYEFLDEKRILLAGELLRQRAAYREAQDTFRKRCATADAALKDAAGEEGLDSLQVYPATSLADAVIEIQSRQCAGQTLLSAEFYANDTERPPHNDSSSRALASCRDAFRLLFVHGTLLAAISASLQRLLFEYRRTERRVRALENVVLPEIHAQLSNMEEFLDLDEQEEVLRLRSLREPRQHGGTAGTA